MTAIRILIATFGAAVAGGPLAAEPYPEQCRIWTCKSAEPAATASLTADAPLASVSVGQQSLPVTEKTMIAPSADGEFHACIGYDAFGDAELMCLLVPG